ncbi:hypothetical protein LRP88_14131 [Fusarium phalaenopsidis]
MQLFGIIVAGLSVASVQAIAVPGLPAAGLLFALRQQECRLLVLRSYLRLSLHLDHGFAAYCYAHWATGSDVGPANSGPDAQWVSYTERVV